MPDKRYVINVQAAIYREDKFLLAKRSMQEDFMPGILALPGGTIATEDESSNNVIHATLIREVREEVNLEIDSIHLLTTRYFEADTEPVINLVFLCRYAGGQAKALDPAEVESVHWMTVDEAIQDDNCQPWTRDYLTMADKLRMKVHRAG